MLPLTRPRRLLRSVSRIAVALLVGSAASTFAAPSATAAPAGSGPVIVPLTAAGITPSVAINLAAAGDQFELLMIVVSGTGCLFGDGFDLDIVAEGTTTTIPMTTVDATTRLDGSCVEILAAPLAAARMAPLARTGQISFVLPNRTIALPSPAIDYLRSVVEENPHGN